MTLPISKRVLILVKTYPTLSSKYDELVCTAGITDTGEWVRIYPMQFRKFHESQQYSKYDWVNIDLIKNPKDPRPETFRPYQVPPEFSIEGSVPTGDAWIERKELVLRNVYTNLGKLIADNKSNLGTSLAIFKPTQVLDFIIEPDDPEWDPVKVKDIEARSKQMNLLEEMEVFTLIPKLPFKFKYRFIDDEGKESTMMIEDWEIGSLYWNCLNTSGGNPEAACKKVKEKYLDYFTKERDLHFFLGTTRQFDKWANNPFIIIGAFYSYPPPLSWSFFIQSMDFLLYQLWWTIRDSPLSAAHRPSQKKYQE